MQTMTQGRHPSSRRCLHPTTMLPRLLVAALVLLLSGPVRGDALPAGAEPVPSLVARMEAAWAGLEQYRCDIEVREFRAGRLESLRQFRYSFRRPDQVRVDLVSPYRGMTLVYPDAQGRVLVKPGGPGGVLAFRLAPGNALLRSGAGQRLDQTHLGLLIANIAHSLSDWRRGPVGVTETEREVVLEVLSRDHFRPEQQTRYRFSIDRRLWLPVKVDEFDPDGAPRRSTTLRDLHGGSFPEGFFRAD